MPLGHLKIHGVMRGGNLQCACTKGRVHSFISDNRYGAGDHGNGHTLAYQAAETLVGRIDRHSSITEHGLGTSGGYHDVARLTNHGVVDVIKMTFYLSMFRFQVGESRPAAGTPVDNPFPSIDKSLLV